MPQITWGKRSPKPSLPYRPILRSSTVNRRGSDHQAVLRITLEEAFRGGTKTITLQSGNPATEEDAYTHEKHYDVHIPPGILPGQKIRLSGGKSHSRARKPTVLGAENWWMCGEIRCRNLPFVLFVGFVVQFIVCKLPRRTRSARRKCVIEFMPRSTKGSRKGREHCKECGSGPGKRVLPGP